MTVEIVDNIDQITSEVLRRLSAVFSGVADACAGRKPAVPAKDGEVGLEGDSPGVPFMPGDVLNMDATTINANLSRLGITIKDAKAARATLFVVAALMIGDKDSLSGIPASNLRGIAAALGVMPCKTKKEQIRKLGSLDLSPLKDADIEYQGAKREVEVTVGMNVSYEFNGEILGGNVTLVNARTSTCYVTSYDEDDWAVPLDKLLYAGWNHPEEFTTGPAPVHYFVRGYRLDPRTGEIVERRSDGRKIVRKDGKPPTTKKRSR